MAHPSIDYADVAHASKEDANVALLNSPDGVFASRTNINSKNDVRNKCVHVPGPKISDFQ